MLIWSTVNPEGEQAGYSGFYLTQCDIDHCVKNNSLIGKPVKVEHKGQAIGKVVSTWKSGGKLDCLMEISDELVGSRVLQEYIAQGRVDECSLGYRVNMQSSAQSVKHLEKDFVEVSIVKKGDRPKCKIHAFTVT